MDRTEIIYLVGKDPLLETGGGHSNYARAHAWAARRAGYHPHLFCLSRDEGEVETEYGTVHRIRTPWKCFFPLPKSAISGWVACLEANRMARLVVRFLRSRPDVRLIHGFGVWARAGVLAARQCRTKGREIIVVASAYDTLRNEYEARRRALPAKLSLRQRLRFTMEHLLIRLVGARSEALGYEGAERILVNYRSVERLLQATRRRQLPVERVPYAPERAFFAQGLSIAAAPEALCRLKPADAPLILSMSEHYTRKGLDILLRALGLLRQRGQRFRACLLGGGVLLDYHRQLAKDLPLGESTVLTGNVPDVSPYLIRSDVFVLPSLEEGSGSVALLEAMQQGRAIVTTAVDGLKEDIEEGKTGLFVPPGDAGALASVLERLLKDAPLRRRLGDAARVEYARRFSAEGFCQALGAVYGELLGVNRSATRLRRAA